MLALEVWVPKGAVADKREKAVGFTEEVEAWRGQEWSRKRLSERELHTGSMAGLHEQ